MSEVYKATKNKIKINTTSDSDVYKATKNAQVTDTEAYKKTLGNKIQQDVAGKINHRFTPDFSKTNVAKTIVETKNPELKTTIPSKTYDESYVKELQLKNNMNAAKREYEETKANDDRNILVKFLQMGSDLSPVHYTKTRYDKAKKDYEDFKSAKYYSSLPNGTVKSTNPDKDFFKANDSIDMKYEYINDINNARDFVRTTSSATGSKNAYKIYDNMTDREIGIYNYLYETEGKNKAEEFLKFLETDLDALLNQDVAKFNKQFAEKFPILSSAASVAGTFASVGEQLKNYGEYLATGNMKTNKMATATSTIRDTVSKKVDVEVGNWDAFDFVYNTVMSGVDSFVAASSGPLGAVALGLSAAGSTTNDILARGGDSSQAFWGGAAAGVFEGFFEKFSIGQLNAMQEGAVKGFKDYALNLVKSMGVNFSEEAATEVANILYDYAINGGISNYSIMVQEFVDNGDSLEVAKKKAAEQLGLQVLEAGASGALMGFGFASISSAASYKNASSIGKMIAANESESEVLNAALSMNGNTESYKMASEIKNSGEITTAKMGGLVSQIMSDISNQKNVAIETAVSERAKELGIDSKTAQKLTSYLTKAATNGKIETIEADAIGKNAKAQQIINEIKNNDVWAQSMNSQLSLLEKTEQTVRNAITLNTPETAVQSTPTTENEVESEVVPVEQSGEVLETPVVSQQERETVFTEPTNQEIYRDPTAEENAEAMFGRRKSAKQRHIIDVAKKLDSNMKVVFVDKNSKSLNGKNGKYNRDTNTMYIAKDLETNDIKLVEAYVEVFKHEFVHRLELRKAYKSFKDYLFKKSSAFEKYAKARLYYRDGVDKTDLARDEAINGLIDMYVENSKGDLNLTREQAEREAVADFVARTLFKEKSADFLQAIENENIYDKEKLNGFAQMETDLELFEEMAKTDRNLLQKIIDAIRDLINSIKGITNLEKDLQYIEERLTRVYESADNKKTATESGEVYYSLTINQARALDIDWDSNNHSSLKEQLKNHLDEVNEMQPVATVVYNKQSKKPYYKILEELLKEKFGNKIERREYGTITFEQSAINGSRNYVNNDAEAAAIISAPYVLKRGKAITGHKNHKEKGNVSITFAAPVILNGKRGNVVVCVLYGKGQVHSLRVLTPDGGNFELLKIKDIESTITGHKIKNVGEPYIESMSNDSISNGDKNVNSSFSSDNLDTDYLKAVKKGDMETAQRMVDEAAEIKGYDSPHLYHGTRSFGFTQFDLEKMDDKSSIFLTDNKKIASTYSGVTGVRDISDVKEISKLSAKDLVKTFNAYDERFTEETTEGKGNYELYDFKKFNKLLATVNSGIKDLLKIVDKQIKIYAEKMAVDFDEKDSKVHNQLVNLLDKLKKYDYDNLSTPIYMLLHHSDVFDKDPKIAELESNIRLINKLKNMDLSEGVITSEHLGGYDIQVMSIDTARMELENKYKQGNMTLVAKLGKSLVIDGKNQNWNDIRNWQEAAYRKRDEVEIKKIGDEFKLYDKKTNSEIPNGTMAVNSFTEKLDKSALLTMMLDNANYSLRILTEDLFNTREISNWAKNNGYDSVTIKNIRDNGGMNSAVDFLETADVYIIFNPNNVKSADPVTYDDNGNVIPLSKRFNDEDIDIRYSSDDLSALQRDLYDRNKNGEITNEEYLEETDRLWGKANEEYGSFPQGEKVQLNIPVPMAVAEDKPTERFIRTIIETDTLNGDMLKGMQESTLLGDFAYDVISDESAIKIANKAIENKTANTIWDDVVSDGKRINKNKIAIGEQLLANAIKDGKTFEVLKLSAELADILTRAGQVVQAARLLKKMTGAGRLVSLQRTVKTINKDLVKKYGEAYPPVKISEESARRLADAKTAGGVEYAYQQILQEVADQVPSTLLDKWNAWRYFAMLSNPKTHIRNIVGNAIFLPTVRIKDGIAQIMELGVDQSKKTKSFIVKPEYRDFAKRDSQNQGIKNLLKGNKYNDKSAIKEKQKIFKTELLNFLTEFNSNALEAEDMFFKNKHYIHALGSFLQARKVDLANVSEEMLWEARTYAVKEAKKATFNDESALANWIQNFGNKNLATSIAVEGVLPFKRTPINIVKRGIEYSPIGLANAIKKRLFDVKKGKITVTECIDGLASGLTGTGIMLVGMLLANLGWVTGGEDDDEKSQFERWLGKQEYAVEILGKSYTVDWAAPANIPFFIGVEIANIGRNEEDFTFANVFNTMWNALEPITNLSMLSGMQSVIESARYADSAQTLSAIAVDAITSYGMQAVPSLSGALARTIDPTQRSWYIDKNDKVLDSTAQTIKNNIQSKVPGLSYTQIPKIDMWGREVSRGGTAERVLENFVSPGYYSEIEITETSEELKRIFKETDVDVFPNIAAKSFELEGKTKQLTAQEYVTYAKAKGRYSYDYIEEFMQASSYKKLTDAEKADVITNLYKYANAKAKTTVSNYDLMKQFKTVTNWERNGSSAVDYYIYRAISK